MAASYGAPTNINPYDVGLHHILLPLAGLAATRADTFAQPLSNGTPARFRPLI